MGMHPNVATCYYVLNIDGTPYLFIEYVDGGDLKSWLKSGRCKDQRTLLSMAVQFCHGMEFTHSKGIIHRDIKPGNILLTKNALLKITDFGIIQTVGSSDKEQPLTKTYSDKTVGFRGTPSYASPEQFRDTHNVDFRSDIFSFGICLWLMFCGRRPFKSNALPGKAEPSPADPKSPFPTLLRQLLIKSVAFDPRDRFQNFSELRMALNEVHIDLFKVPCPFMDLDFADLQAENLNNRAISFFELGKEREGYKCLQRALDVDDTLPEAIFNYTLFKWRKGHAQTKLHKQLEAIRKRFPDATMFDTLAQSIRCDLHQDVWTIQEGDEDSEAPCSPSHKTYFPEYLLCLPKKSLDIFQSCQLTKAAKANMLHLLEKKRHAECADILFNIWGNKGFKKDNNFQKIYEKLLTAGVPKKLRAVIRLQTLRYNSSPAQKIFCLPGKKNIFVLCRDGKIFVYNPKSPGKVNVLGNYKSVSAISLSPDGNRLALGHRDGNIEVLSLDSGKRLAQFTSQGEITSIAVNAKSTCIGVGFANGRIRTYSLLSGKEFLYPAEEGGAITALDCFDQIDNFISGSEDGTMRFWSLNQPDPVRIAKAHFSAVKALSPSSNSRLFVSGEDKHLKIWDRQTGQCKKSLATNEDDLSAALFIPNSNYFASAGSDDIIKIWEASAEKPDFLLDGRGDGIISLAPGPFPHMFLAGCQDGSIIIWMLVYELAFS
jgi:serine/threonine protein kinase